MSLFDKQKEVMGIPKDGDKIIFSKPATFAFFTNVIDDQKLLEIGKEYTVRKTNLNSSSTYVWLEEIPTYDEERDLPFFNLWSFTWKGREVKDGEIDKKEISEFWAKIAGTNTLFPNNNTDDCKD
jgi:hypothetical protein